VSQAQIDPAQIGWLVFDCDNGSNRMTCCGELIAVVEDLAESKSQLPRFVRQGETFDFGHILDSVVHPRQVIVRIVGFRLKRF
jgi:hypothetical protein